MKLLYDLAIIGGGPAGVAAGVYASRKRLRTIFLTRDWGGQSLVSPEIQNWVGTVKVSGLELSDMLKNHLLAYADEIVDIRDGVEVEKIEKSSMGFSIAFATEQVEAKAVLVTAGSRRRKLAIPGAEKFDNKGVTYCASCDGPLFTGLDVAVIGGGNAGFETAAQLIAYCKSVTLLHRSDDFKADPITVKKVLANPKVKVQTGVEPTEVKGDATVSALAYKSVRTGETGEIAVQGVFVEIGSMPNSAIAKGLVELDTWNQIVVDPMTQRTSVSGIWAAGDITNGRYHQNNIAAGDAVKALEDIYMYLHTK